jgi:hypothetical protein
LLPQISREDKKLSDTQSATSSPLFRSRQSTPQARQNQQAQQQQQISNPPAATNQAPKASTPPSTMGKSSHIIFPTSCANLCHV